MSWSLPGVKGLTLLCSELIKLLLFCEYHFFTSISFAARIRIYFIKIVNDNNSDNVDYK